MTAVAVRPPREALAPFLLAGGLGLASVGMAFGGGAAVLGGAGAGALLLGAVLARAPHIRWQSVLALLVLVILFIPLRRYKLPGDAGFSLEPYRLLVAAVLAGWGAALLVDARVQLRKSGLERVIVLVLLTAVGSVLVNPTRAATLQPAVLKSVTFLLSFIIVFYFLVSVIRTRDAVDTVAKTLVAGGALVGLLCIVEARTGLTPFTQLDVVFPFLNQDPSFEGPPDRAGALRAVGSAEHPIAMGAALVMIVPLAIYVARFNRGARWYLALGLLVLGTLSTVSRTGILMLLLIGITFLWLRPKESRRLMPLVVPVVVATNLLVPGTLGALHGAFFPEDGLIAQQQTLAGSCSSSGRIADLGPTFTEASKKPLLGYGYGTRITTGVDANACILDNQWLGTLLDVGIAGVIAWFLLFKRVLAKFGRPSKGDDSPEGWMLTAVSASVLAFAIGMLTFDSFGFSQVTFLLFILLGLGAAVLQNRNQSGHSARAV